MKTNKIDKSIKEKLDNRVLKPSASAWERLSAQLDEQPKQKRFGWLFYISAAASILLLVSIGVQIFSIDSDEIQIKEEVVILPIDKNKIDAKINKLINTIPVPEAVVKKGELLVQKEIIHSPVIAKRQKQSIKNNADRNIINNKKVIAQVDENNTNPNLHKIGELKNQDTLKDFIKQGANSTIKINADDLLYAVTHSSKEVKAYYAKYNVNKEDILRTIKGELKKSKLKVNPNTILAEVERNINDDFFENNFMKSLKRRVSDIAAVIASRNN